MDITPLTRVDFVPESPASILPPQEQAQNRDIVLAVKAINKAELLGDQEELTFAMDRDGQQVVIRLVDRNTREVLRQIPPEYVLEMARDLRNQAL